MVDSDKIKTDCHCDSIIAKRFPENPARWSLPKSDELKCACEILDAYTNFTGGNNSEKQIDKLVKLIVEILPSAIEVTEERLKQEKDFVNAMINPAHIPTLPGNMPEPLLGRDFSHWVDEINEKIIDREKQNLDTLTKLNKLAKTPSFKYMDRFVKVVDFIDTFVHLTHAVEPVLANACTWKFTKQPLSDMDTRELTKEVLDCLAK